jgi:hypothetical protein
MGFVIPDSIVTPSAPLKAMIFVAWVCKPPIVIPSYDANTALLHFKMLMGFWKPESGLWTCMGSGIPTHVWAVGIYTLLFATV